LEEIEMSNVMHEVVCYTPSGKFLYISETPPGHIFKSERFKTRTDRGWIKVTTFENKTENVWLRVSSVDAYEIVDIYEIVQEVEGDKNPVGGTWPGRRIED
jgi:hypothetical protein